MRCCESKSKTVNWLVKNARSALQRALKAKRNRGSRLRSAELFFVSLSLRLDALDGKTPGDFMDTANGRTLVAGLVAQMQSGAYA